MTKQTHHDRKFAQTMAQIAAQPGAAEAIAAGVRTNNPVFMVGDGHGLILRAFPVRDQFTFPEEAFFADFAEQFADEIAVLISNTLNGMAEGLPIGLFDTPGRIFIAARILDESFTVSFEYKMALMGPGALPTAVITLTPMNEVGATAMMGVAA